MTFTLQEYESAFSSEETLNDFFQKSHPSDFYFKVDEYDGFSYTVIVAKVFFDNNNCVDDQTPRIEHLLPDDFCEAMEST